MGATAMIGAIAFDPTIRGILVVLTGTVVLIGSIFMILSTNSGVRVGFLITASALFGWMFLMTSVWVIYGIGLRGRDPAWMPTDINYSRDEAVSGLPEISKLPSEENLPKAEAILEEKPLIHAVVLGSEGKDYSPATLTKLKTVIQPFVTIRQVDLAPLARKTLKQAEEFPDGNVAQIFEDNPDVKAALETAVAGSVSDLQEMVHTQASDMREEIEQPLAGWCLLTESDPRRGEAQASSDAALAANKAFGDPTSTASYITLDVFFYGGKEPCDPITERSSIRQAWHRLATAFEVKNPKLLAAVTVVKAKEQVTVDGQTPPPAAADPDASVVTVGMLRNLGSRRLVPFSIAVVCFVLFAFFTSLLHYRDKNAMAVRAAFSGAGKD